MSEFFAFIGGLIKLALFIAFVLGVFAWRGYNRLRELVEAIREGMSNIGVVGKKQVSLINQLIDVVKGYQESEKLVMLKISEDLTTAGGVAQMHQQSGVVMSTVSGMAQRFPELKASDQYQRLIQSIQSCEQDLEAARQAYNRQVNQYNTVRSQIPAIFYAPLLGFKAAPYLEFREGVETGDMSTLKTFAADDDGERLNALLGAAGSQAKKVGALALSGGKDLATKAIEGGKVLIDSAQQKVKEINEQRDAGQADKPTIVTASPEFHYLDKDKNPAGPVSQSELQQLYQSELITAETMILASGSRDWIRYGQLRRVDMPVA